MAKKERLIFTLSLLSALLTSLPLSFETAVVNILAEQSH